MNKLLTGSNNKAEAAIIEAIYAGGAVAIPWFATYVTNNPSYFSPYTIIACRFLLSWIANGIVSATV